MNSRLGPRATDAPDANRDPAFWRGHYTAPFYRPDREAEMTRVYRSFQARLATLDGSGHR